MLYDIDYTWIIAVGILIGLPLVLTFLAEEKFNFTAIIVYMTIINAFIVSTDFLPLWTQVLFLLLTVAVGVIEVRKERNEGI